LLIIDIRYLVVKMSVAASGFLLFQKQICAKNRAEVTVFDILKGDLIKGRKYGCINWHGWVLHQGRS
jgi:hypothetical protein